MRKDRATGVLIFLLCALTAVGYLIFFFVPIQYLVGLARTSMAMEAHQFRLLAIPFLIASTAIMSIGVWMGWTMATKLPPEPVGEPGKKTAEND